MFDLKDIVRRQKAGEAAGLYSVCSASGHVVAAAMRQAMADGSPVCIEATSNQVNQFGGYTGMSASDFAGFVRGVGERNGFPGDRLILGGDHLGPNVWRGDNAGVAMEKACGLVASFAAAGFSKLHLDASMRCGGDPGRLPVATIAERSALMCAAAEKAWGGRTGGGPFYVIGSEVPQPGGATDETEQLHVTEPDDVDEIVQATRAAFGRHGVDSAWDRVVAVVVQPGVEFGDTSVVAYDRGRARELSRHIEGMDGLVYEAHSTDYQSGSALARMVEDHFAVLKVGPWLTYAQREALFALEQIEKELHAAGRQGAALSGFRAVLDRVMAGKPGHWASHYRGSEEDMRFARMFSYSDRCRYYLPDPEVAGAMRVLMANLSAVAIPATLLSQYMPQQYYRVMEGLINPDPVELLIDRIRVVLAMYAGACGLQGGME